MCNATSAKTTSTRSGRGRKWPFSPHDPTSTRLIVIPVQLVLIMWLPTPFAGKLCQCVSGDLPTLFWIGTQSTTVNGMQRSVSKFRSSLWVTRHEPVSPSSSVGPPDSHSSHSKRCESTIQNKKPTDFYVNHNYFLRDATSTENWSFTNRRRSWARNAPFPTNQCCF